MGEGGKMWWILPTSAKFSNLIGYFLRVIKIFNNNIFSNPENYSYLCSEMVPASRSIENPVRLKWESGENPGQSRCCKFQ